VLGHGCLGGLQLGLGNWEGLVGWAEMSENVWVGLLFGFFG